MAIKGPPIIKLSGKALSDTENLKKLFQTIGSHTAIIVHGGGVEVDALLKKVGIVSQKIDGIRVSPASDMPYICGALCGMCNKQLQGLAIAQHKNALGLLATDGNTITLQKFDEKYGKVASAIPHDGKFIQSLLESGILPIICSIGIDDKGELYNINADDVASALAKLFNSDLYFISDVKGVLDGNGKQIECLNNKSVAKLIEDKIITDGMIVKVKMALDVANNTKTAVTIASINDPQLFANLFSLRRFGTTFNAQ